MSKFSKLDGQNIVVESVLLESITTNKKWALVPGESVGPIKLGMSRDAVKTLFNTAPKTFKKTKSSKNTADDFKNFHVFYDENDKVNGVEIFDGITVSMNGKTIFPTSKDKAKDSKGYSYYIDGDDVYSVFCESTEIPEILTEAATQIADIKSEAEFKKQIDALYKNNVEIRTLMLYAVSSAERFLNFWDNDGIEVKYPKMAQVTKMLKSQKNDKTGKSGIRGVRVVNGKNSIGDNDFVAITEFRGKCVANFTVNNRTAVDAMLLFIQSVPDAEDEIFGFKLNDALREARDHVKVTHSHV